MAAYPITIPGAYARGDSTIMSPSSIASPLSISSPYSVHSSLSNNSIAGQTQASSFATSVNSTSTVASALSPCSEDEGIVVDGIHSTTTAASTTTTYSAADASLKKNKPHECDVCGACFARKVHLQRHSLRHQVCKPYCCERCGKCFSRQDSLVRHHRLLHEKIKDKPKRAISSTKKKTNGTNRNSIKTSLPSSSYFQQQEIENDRSQRRQSTGQITINSTSSVFEDDEDEEEDMMSISEETSAFSPLPSFGVNHHGPRRATVSNMETLSYQSEFQCSFPRVYDDSFNPAASSNIHWSSQLHQPLHHQQHQHHHLEMPNLDTINFADVKSLHPQQLHQHMVSAPGTQTFYDASISTPSASTNSDQEMPLLSLFQQSSLSPEQSQYVDSPSPFDWNSIIHSGMSAGEHGMGSEARTPALPFSKSALDKSLNFTLSRGPESNSCLPSPSIQTVSTAAAFKQFPSVEQHHQIQKQHHQYSPEMAASTLSIPTSGTVNLASLGLPVPPNLNISLPADLQMSAENWDNLMRCLTLMANRPATTTTTAAAASSTMNSTSMAGEDQNR